MASVEQTFHIARQHHRGGRLGEAEALYRQILQEQPNHPGTLHLLGIIAVQTGRNEEAVELLGRLTAVEPDVPESYGNLANVLRKIGRLEEAMVACRRALALNPNWAEGHGNLGIVLKDKGALTEAVSEHRQAVALKPQWPEGHNNLGVALQTQGQLEEAIGAYRQAIAVKYQFPEAHRNLGLALKDMGRLKEAIAAFQEAIAVNPQYADAWINLGNALRDAGKFEEAIAAHRQGIPLKPEAESWNNLGAALQDSGQLEAASAAYRRAIELKPHYADAHFNLGNILTSKGHAEEAIAAFRQAIALKPNYAEAHSNLGNALRGRGQLDEATAAFRRAIELDPKLAEASTNLGNALKDKGQLEEAIAAHQQALSLEPQSALYNSNLVYTLHFHPAYDARAIAEEHRQWNRRHAEPLRQQIPAHARDRSPERRLRIGYVSPDFRQHPVGRFLLPLLAHHDKKQVEIFAYAQLATPDALTDALRSHCDVWRSIRGLSDEQAAELIRGDQVDILVDLTMHMCDNRLLVFARKPAPVQATYLAYCSSTGLEAIDYRLSDPYLDPPGMDESVYSERTIRVAESYWCYQPCIAPSQLPAAPDDPPASTRWEASPLPALERGHITFGCLNNFCKASAPALAAWARILREAPDSHLLLHAREGSHRQRLREQFQHEGIEGERVEFAGFMASEQYLDQYRRIDVALDTFPYGGGTTTCDALWMGVPVVSLAGRTAVGRGGVSILSNLGMPELVARSEEEYVEIARGQAGDLPRLSRLRATLRERMLQSPLMDGQRFARNIEAVYREMWREWCGRGLGAGSV